MYDVLKELGAIEDTEVAKQIARFGNPASEVRAARTDGGYTLLSGWDKFRFIGQDAIRFVHGMVSNDVKGLADSSGNHTCVLTNKGKILADFFLYRQDKDLLGFAIPGRGKVIVESLERYIIADKVAAELTTDKRDLIGFYAAPGVALATSIAGANVSPDAGMVMEGCDIDGVQANLFLAPHAPGVHAVLSVPKEATEDILKTVTKRARETGISPYGAEALRLLAMEDGRPWYGTDFDDSNFPDEAALPHTVHYKKGCYIGQETIARIHYLGHVNKHLVGLFPDAPVEAGAEIQVEENKVGHVTSAADSPTLERPIALGHVKREHAESGTEVRIVSGDDSTRATVRSLPIVP